MLQQSGQYSHRLCETCLASQFRSIIPHLNWTPQPITGIENTPELYLKAGQWRRLVLLNAWLSELQVDRYPYPLNDSEFIGQVEFLVNMTDFFDWFLGCLDLRDGLIFAKQEFLNRSGSQK